MIRIDRGGMEPPSSLARRAAAALQRLRKARDTRAIRSADFQRNVYAAQDVRLALWRLQHRKCCYCESTFEQKYSTVEHFRPKTFALRGVTRDEGYWWLAYRFDNLCFCCPTCNNWKGDHFPLEDGASALSPEEDPRLVEERPLLLDPAFDDVEEHLTFVSLADDEYRMAARNRSARGKATIRIVRLNRDDLLELRAAYYRRSLQPLIERHRRATRVDDRVAFAEVKQDVERATAADAPFALLAREVLRREGAWPG